jgi:hypothetical protein
VELEQLEGQLDLANGLTLRPQLVSLKVRETDSVSTVSTIEVNHAELCPQGTFEHQHAIGSTLSESLETGFNGWADIDLPVFMDALRVKLEQSTAMDNERGTTSASSSSGPRAYDAARLADTAR